MSEFRRIEHAQRSPTSCVACGTSTGPFVDLQVDIHPYGNLLLCAARPGASGCVRQIAALDGMIEGERYDELHRTLSTAEWRISTLEDQLLAANDKALVSVSELFEMANATQAGETLFNADPEEIKPTDWS